MIKLIASDLDGTLIPEATQNMNPDTLRLIEQLVDRGIYFVVASGREYENERYLFGPIKDKISYIAANGSLCIHKGEIVSRSVMPPEIIREILTELSAMPGFEPFMSGDDGCYVESHNLRFMGTFSDVMKIYGVENLLDVTAPIRKVALCNATNDPDTALRYTRRLQEVFSGRVKVVTSGNDWIDFLMPDCNKGTALKKLMQLLDVRPEECMAFGDQQNDIEMLQCAGHSYAMKTAAPGVSAHAAYITDSPEKVMEQLLKQLLPEKGSHS